MIQILENAQEAGVYPDDSDADRMRFDRALTLATMQYLSDLLLGKENPEQFCLGFDVAPKKCDLSGLILDRIVGATDVAAVLARLQTRFAAYRRTKQALRTYIALAQLDDGEPLPAVAQRVEPGGSYTGVPRLYRLLLRLGDLPPQTPEPTGQLYHGALVDGVKHFQARHGLEPDGRIGGATLRQLNTPLTSRVVQLRRVLERSRWIPGDLDRPGIVVNIPEFRLRAVNSSDQADLEMKVVVGGVSFHQTPVFANQITHVIFRPYWNVPVSIQKYEIVPHLLKDPAYLAKNDYQIVNNRGEVQPSDNVDAKTAAQIFDGKLWIRQIPGPINSLGLVKFMFPNQFDVYLHGTPARGLFARSRRDLSHGCIRVEKPQELVAWVLKEQPKWTSARIKEALEGDEPLRVNLDKSIPVRIVYDTAAVKENGDVFFFDDVYGYDATLDVLLGTSPPASQPHPTSD